MNHAEKGGDSGGEKGYHFKKMWSSKRGRGKEKPDSRELMQILHEGSRRRETEKLRKKERPP